MPKLKSSMLRSVRQLTAVLTSLAAYSIAAADVDWTGGVTTVYQHVDDSRVESELTASADLFATIARPAGEWLIYIEASSSPNPNGVSAFYPTVNGDARSVLTRNGSGGIQISEANYTFYLHDSRTLMVGLIDPSAWLDRGRIANDENIHFLNGSFVNNATIEFPDYTLGGVLRILGNQSRPELTLILAGSDGIADLPDRSYQDLLDLTSEERGVFLGAGASWLYQRTSWRIGAWLRTDDHVIAGGEEATETNHGLYGVYGWQAGANALNVRFGIANSDVAIADRFAGVAYQRKTRIGLFGIGVARTYISSVFREPGRDNALDSEIYLRVPVFGETGHITPSIQYVENPGFEAASSVSRSSAVVASIRLHWAF